MYIKLRVISLGIIYYIVFFKYQFDIKKRFKFYLGASIIYYIKQYLTLTVVIVRLFSVVVICDNKTIARHRKIHYDTDVYIYLFIYICKQKFGKQIYIPYFKIIQKLKN